MIKLRFKIFLIVFGIGGALLILEVGLSLFSCFTLQFDQGQQQRSQCSDQAIEILCLGDSFTYGVGAGFSNSYPAQMRDILQQATQKEVTIINGGISSSNSAIVLNKLKIFLERIEPDIVVVMTGHNDSWNFRNIRNKFGWRIRLKSFFSLSRVGKLIAIGVHNMQYAICQNKYLTPKENNAKAKDNPRTIEGLIAKANAMRSQKLFNEASLVYEKILANNPRNAAALLEMGRNYKMAQDYNRALRMLELSLAIELQRPSIYAEIEDIFIKKGSFSRAVSFYSRMMLRYPENERIKRSLVNNYMHWGDELYFKNDYAGVLFCYQRAVALDPENAGIYNRIYYNKALEYDDTLLFASITDRVKSEQKNRSGRNVVDEITASNLREMAELCKMKGISLIISGYPEIMYEVLIKVAGEYNLVLVDHTAVFKSGVVKKNPQKYFTADRHCTKEGYKLVAANIAAVIIDLDGKYSNEIKR